MYLINSKSYANSLNLIENLVSFSGIPICILYNEFSEIKKMLSKLESKFNEHQTIVHTEPSSEAIEPERKNVYCIRNLNEIDDTVSNKFYLINLQVNSLKG